jgi:hypothetical protein
VARSSGPVFSPGLGRGADLLKAARSGSPTSKCLLTPPCANRRITTAVDRINWLAERRGYRMRRVVRFVSPLVAAGAIGGWPAAALADSPAQTPFPIGARGCNGLIIASFNHIAGSPSGNSTASAGPGSSFGPDTHQAIEQLARDPNC